MTVLAGSLEGAPLDAPFPIVWRDEMLGRQLQLSKHARDMVDEREIPLEWIERVLENRAFEEPDVEHPGATRAYAPIIEFGNRMLRVVYYDTGSVVRVITLFFDRRATRRSRRP